MWLAAFSAAAQKSATKEIRYVSKYGKYSNDGKTWATSKNNVQDAINDLANKGLAGEVWVARGVYTPTESTESNGGSTLYMSFKVPAGITVRGGFFGPGKVPGNDPSGTQAANSDSIKYFRELMFETCKTVGLKDKTVSSANDIVPGDWFLGETAIEQRALYHSSVNAVNQDKTYPYLTIFSGDLSQSAKFEWNAVKQWWDASFYGNCYHVVWFATNGFHADGRAKALTTTLGEAVVEGVTIMNGNARNNELTGRAHNAYGGGVYMVAGSRLENCNVQQCEASRDGGGIYMDGGGVVRHCYINNCQALGISTQSGYGGGVCLETNEAVTTNRMGMYRSVINGCVARFGGGAAINTKKATAPDGEDLRYKPFLSASAIYNNTATTEAGGLYMNNGGAVSNLTLTRNRCNGTGVISNGMATGRAGGLYCRDHAVVFNSVLWGNECEANNNMQFASSQSTVSPDLRVDMRYCAVAYADYTDWSTTSKKGIFSLSPYNTKVDAGANASENDVYPHFNHPSPNAGYVNIKTTTDGTETQTQAGLRRFYDWQPGPNSGLANAGIIAVDLNTTGKLPFRSLYQDVLGNNFNPRATLGGYTRKFGTMTSYQDGNGDYHFYVDPDASTARELDDLTHGVSWDQPAHFLSNVLYTIYTDEKYKKEGVTTYIHVKEGTVNNTNSYVDYKRVREMTIGVRSNNLVILGSYPKELNGTELTRTDTDANGNQTVYERNPLLTPTFISGVITGENDYPMNAAHLMQFDKCENVVFDGFQIRHANASSSLFDASSTDGGAIRLINGAKNITFRNLIIAGNTADRGAAIFAEDGTSATFENVIIHNNEAKEIRNQLQGIIHTLGTASLTFNHCNILNNVGHPAYLEGTSKQQFANSIFFANAEEPHTEAYGTAAYDIALPSFAGQTGGVTAFNCLFDAVSYSFQPTLDATNKYNLIYTLNGKGFPRFVNGVHNIGVSVGGDETYYGRATSFEPHNENPMVNAAKSTLPTGFTGTWGTTDLSTHIERTYGGLPDIGAIENHAATSGEGGGNSYAGGQQPINHVYYVRKPVDGGDDSNSGLSWSEAFATIDKAIKTANATSVPTGQYTETVTVNSITRSSSTITSVADLAATSHFQIRSARPNENGWNYTESWWNVSGNSVSGLGDAEPNNNTPLPIGTVFMLEDATPTNDSDNYYHIKSMTKSYLAINGTSGSPALSATESKNLATIFIIEYQTSNGYTGFTFRTIDSGGNYLNAYSNVNIGWWTLDQGGIWSAYSADVDYATTKTDIIGRASVYVAAGTYAENLTMSEGVNVYGGFPTTGNPGEAERNISNKAEGYMTIIDGGGTTKNQRVITQSEDFDDFSTMFEGFIIQNGYTTGTNYGAGVRLMKNGVIKNCLIQNNQFTANENTAANMGGGGMYVSNGGLVKNSIIRSNRVIGNQGSYVGGAGLISAGGEFQNSLIVENTAENNTNILGAAVIINSQSNLYNCTIAYNKATNNRAAAATGGVWDFAATHNSSTNTYSNTSKFYNCIVWGNVADGTTLENYVQIGMAGYTHSGGNTNDSFFKCYSSGAVAVKKTVNDKPTDLSSDLTSDTTRVKICIRLKNNNQKEVAGVVNGIDWSQAYVDTCMMYEPFVRDAEGNTEYDLKKDAYGCINMGSYHGMLETLGINEDIVGDPRIIDCTVDKGAYEYYDSYAITPRVIYKEVDGKQVIDETKAATFYVTPNGNGLASGDSPKNAACAAKLQRVLDAAGRYKFQHPKQQIIVKVANSKAFADNNMYFPYYATRTTNEENDDVRIWSIIVPRGVEVWGGYSDAFTDDDHNGFYTKDGDNITDNRNITGNPTYFGATYHSSDLDSDITTYHVVSFTDKVFDGDGLPYMVGDKIGEPSSYGKTRETPEGTPLEEIPSTAVTTTYMLMGDPYSHNAANGTNWGGVTDRAVIDGIYITSGQADLQAVNSGSTDLNINRYGGAAIVTDFAHVRNCILQKNQAIYGGALALTHGALVSGCLIDQNTANYGGAIYVFEHGNSLSDGTDIKTSNDPDDYTPAEGEKNEGLYDPESTEVQTRWDYRMPHVFSTTIVNNKAKNQGGGVWYSNSTANVRFNSTVVWGNNCQDQPNVCGLYNVTRPDEQSYVTTEYYPFNYSAVQDIQPSGLNNYSVDAQSRRGVRFHKDGDADRDAMAQENQSTTDFDRYAQFGHYELTNYSVLNRAGMPLSQWEEITEVWGYDLSDTDFKHESRFVVSETNSTARNNIEIGAMAFDKHFPTEELMLRLFVAKPKDVDIDAATAAIAAAKKAGATDVAKYYAQEGSSFAYPMTKLQDALDYIYMMRGFVAGQDAPGTVTDDANNMPFEIYLGPGTYYPSIDPTGNAKNTVGVTFVIPEGVSLVGGFNPAAAVDKDGKELTDTKTEKHFLGRHRLPDHKTPEASGWDAGNYYVDSNTKLPTEDRHINPYEFIDDNNITYRIHHVHKDLCGSTRKISDINANSIVEPWEFTNQTILSGKLEGLENSGVNHIVTIHADQRYVGALPHTQGPSNGTADNDPYHPMEYGQTIALDGITFNGGYAHSYQPNTVDNVHKVKFNHGGAILIDTNHYWNAYNKQDNRDAGLPGDAKDYANPEYKRMGSVASVGYREIPVVINRCKFENNIAGYGGAISSNTTLDILNSSFEHNMAKNGDDVVDYTITKTDGTTKEENIHITYPGAGGAIYSTYQLNAINTLFANNEALDESMHVGTKKFSTLTNSINALQSGTSLDDAQSELFGGCGGAIHSSRRAHFHTMNCNFVNNQANAFPAIYTLNPNHGSVHQNTITDAPINLKDYNQAINCVFWGNAINSKMGYTKEQLFAVDMVVNYGLSRRTEDSPYERKLEPTNQTTLNEEDKYSEQVWFSAYEQGKGKDPVNNHDLRDMDMNPNLHIDWLIHEKMEELNHTLHYQNCNVELASENAVTEGPNFVNPSARPGYDGYMESADWAPARLNSLTDAGWGKIKQFIDADHDAKFVTYTKASEIPAGRSEYSSEGVGDYVTHGAYTTLKYLKGNEKYKKTMLLGEQEYMYTTYTDDEGKPVNLYRISYDPNPTHDQTYIDMGVYEYSHTQLEYDTEGEEVDVIWVSTQEKPDNGLPDGSAWSQPTSDLQRAIETLLSSRNGRRKEIRLMDGIFTPIYTVDEKYLSFYINTLYQNTSATIEENAVKGVMSLTIKGGYSQELNGVRDVQEYPAIIRQQRRTDADDKNPRWNHLFLIEDPTQRYGMSDYTNSDDGHFATDELKGVINTFPIQFDGVTLINDNAAAGTDGAVIHYADLETMAEKDTDKSITPTPTNVTTKYVSAAEHDYDVISNPAKLIISKTKIMGSGTHDQAADRSTSSAVYIGTNGGHALLYNNVLHSNYGAPLVAKCETHTINNTFALNGGMVNLGDDKAAGSYIHNSVLWRNNMSETGTPQFALKGFTAVTENKNIFSYNAYTSGDTEHIEYPKANATEDELAANDIHKNNYNVGLKDENDDIIYSPHFVDPENTDIEARDFSLRPSLRLLHKGSDARYDTLKVAKDTGGDMKIESRTEPYAVYDLAYEPSFGLDAGHKTRRVSTIDIGAYEHQNVLNRVLYVNPNNGSSSTQDGMSWEPANAFGHGSLQNAVDLAALYHQAHDGEEAYVFVKGGNTATVNLHTNEWLTIRDGVSVYAGIDPGFIETCEFTQEGTDSERKYDETKLATYVKAVRNNNEGTIGPNAHKLIVLGIKTDPHTKYNDSGNGICSIVDGIYVSASQEGINPTGIITEPVIDVAPNTGAKVVLRNIVVYGNDISKASEEKNVAQIKNALIYEALFRGNQTATDGAVLRLDEGGWAVSITAEGRTETKPTTGGTAFISPYNGHGSGSGFDVEKNNRIVNSIVNYDGQDVSMATDVTDATKYTLSGYNYRRTDENMYYQLTEGSKHINEIQLKNGESSNGFLPDHLKPFVDYRTDRDLMGNPRLLTLRELTTDEETAGVDGLLDRGAFETWKIEKEMVETTENGNTHFAPHRGSVVYIMEGNSLVCGTDFQPGFLLLKDGASLYGNGHNVKCSYLAVERKIKKGGSVVSMPFEMDYKQVYGQDIPAESSSDYGDGLTRPYYKVANDVNHKASGILNLEYDAAGNTKIYTYDGEARSEEDFQFSATSGAWKEIGTTENYSDYIIPANKGILIIPDEDVFTNTTLYEANPESVIYRFTSKGLLWNNDKYVEGVNEVSKSVTLTQYDDRKSTNGGADFTTKEDMGWNCIGLPYLVSDYRTYGNDYTNGAAEYNMNIPHELWLYYDGETYPDGTTEANGDGGFYSVNSWDSNSWHLKNDEVAHIWLGEGFFTQTAAVDGTETLTFYRPVPPSTGSAVKKRGNTRYYADGEEIAPQTGIIITAHHHTVEVSGLQGGEDIRIYDPAGQLFHHATAHNAIYRTRISAPGIYIVKVNAERKKVLIK